MRPLRLLTFALLLASPLSAQWREIVPGIGYREQGGPGFEAFIVAIDLEMAPVQLVASDPMDRGLTVDGFAERYGAVVAINADYFNKALEPVGPARGSCEAWGRAGDQRVQQLLVVGGGKVAIVEPASRDEALPEWAAHVVSGWPMLVRDCQSLAQSLPGSQGFTHSTHPRTAVGLSRSGLTLYLVVVDGRKEGVPGITLPALADFMRDELGACVALNLDGGGSSQMVIEDLTVNRPSDGTPRRVANHFGAVPVSVDMSCESRRMRAEATQ